MILADEIVQAINGADKVHSLRLDGNTIGADAAKSIAQALKKHPEFQVLQFLMNVAKASLYKDYDIKC